MPDAFIDAAVAAAAHHTLKALYPGQADALDSKLEKYLAEIPESDAKEDGRALGSAVAGEILAEREYDGADSPMSYIPGGAPGRHRPDPLYPDQGFLTPEWGDVRPIVAIRRAGTDGNPLTIADRRWTPVGSPEATRARRA
ncbi:hypothetical protein [Sorangium sp. So ce887]|uniref:hypothetical protein n=1 Tax=Sorangium sp. So ce887 TaxID=3133324 RepID=UPI003F5F78DD